MLRERREKKDFFFFGGGGGGGVVYQWHEEGSDRELKGQKKEE